MEDPPAWVRGLFARREREPLRAAGSPPGAPSLAAAVDDHNAFASGLYERLRRARGNLCCSPFSIRTALAMLSAGARGETQAQMRRALCSSVPDAQLHAGCAAMTESLTAAGAGDHEVAVANSLWSQTGAPLTPEFVTLVARQYCGSVTPVDFRGAADAARSTINGWVSDHTRGRIRDVLAPGSLDPATRLVLVNAAYLKARWADPFDADATEDEPFLLEDGAEVRAPLMRKTLSCGYRRGAAVQAVALPYRGADLALVVVLPDQRDGLASLEISVAREMIDASLRQPATSRVDVLLPRFVIRSGTIDLSDALALLGMPIAFTAEADFSAINGRAPPDPEALAVSAVLHQAFVDVNEAGTEAAAATAETMFAMLTVSRGARIPVLRADHPFLFAICDRASRAIVFLGHVVDPTRER